MRTAVVVVLDRDMFRYKWAARHRLRAAESAYPFKRKVLGKERFSRWVVDRLEARVMDEQMRARGDVQPSVPNDLERDRVDQVVEGLLESTQETAPTP